MDEEAKKKLLIFVIKPQNYFLFPITKLLEEKKLAN